MSAATRRRGPRLCQGKDVNCHVCDEIIRVGSPLELLPKHTDDPVVRLVHPGECYRRALDNRRTGRNEWVRICTVDGAFCSVCGVDIPRGDRLILLTVKNGTYQPGLCHPGACYRHEIDNPSSNRHGRQDGDDGFCCMCNGVTRAGDRVMRLTSRHIGVRSGTCHPGECYEAALGKQADDRQRQVS